MKHTPHKVLGHYVRLAQGGWFVIKIPELVRGGYSITTYRERTLWQLERKVLRLPT